ncbi:MAG: hypothetical protein JWQ07_4944 [Ramlibacter sp.]|nr:hypothetical protein [Ramlibacter sp.]
MSQSAKTAIEAWKEANDEARVAENRLARAWDEYENRRGPPVPADLMTEIAKLRARANDLLTVAMDSLKPPAEGPRK